MIRHVSIEIYSDVVCPWCYVGKRRLERALTRLRDSIKPSVGWRAFELNPGMPKEGMDRHMYLETKFGSLDSFREMEAHLIQAAEAEDLTLAFEKISRTPNTFLAHRLIWYAGQRGVQDDVVESLFRGYFTEGADLGSVSTLVLLARRAGLDVEAFLDSDTGTEEVRAEERDAARLGIRAVPYFVLNRAYGISGAQPVDRFAAAIERVAAQGPVKLPI
ncbi:MAG TPA: DsbA family oxidoreductase [Nitrospira sp.]|nr:DsbA family oxidoreductase [Nitrospira sp.]